MVAGIRSLQLSCLMFVAQKALLVFAVASENKVTQFPVGIHGYRTKARWIVQFAARPL